MLNSIQKLRNFDITGLLLPIDPDSPQHHTSASQNQSKSNHLKHSQNIHFQEDDFLLKIEHKIPLESNEYKSPSEIVKRPYWQLNLIHKSIVEGSFMNENIYLPKTLWMQHSIKLSGVAAKTSAFNAIISLIQNENTQHLTISNDVTIIEKISLSIMIMLEEFYVIQNQLSKPFSFIPEIKIFNEEDSIASKVTVSLHIISACLCMFVYMSKQ